jgi:hypothetical protein
MSNREEMFGSAREDHDSTPRTDITSRTEEPGDESRFVGHLNPESIFIAAQSPVTGTASVEADAVGIWSPQKPRNARTESHSSLPVKTTRLGSIYLPDLEISKLFLSQFEAQCLALLPNHASLEALCKIYFDEFHPLFPILDQKSFEKLPSDDPTKVVLNQVVCLVASSSWSSTQFLSIPIVGKPSITGRKAFAQQLSLAARTLINFGVIKDKLVLIQLHSLLSLSMQFSEDRNLCAELNARAVSIVQTLGLHLLTRTDVKDREVATRIFCCVWAMDRLNAAFHGRPVMIHERDLGRGLSEGINAQDGCFQLFLRTILLLDKVIGLYRPNAILSEDVWETGFPTFETLVQQAGASNVKHRSLGKFSTQNLNLSQTENCPIATVEILYHAVAMLSNRSTSGEITRPSTSAQLRQTLSASKIASMVAEDFHEKLSLLPVVPYSLSLALRVFYREFLSTKVPFFRTRVREQLRITCDLLKDLGEIFGAAANIADLAESTLSEVDKVYTSISQQQHHNRLVDDIEQQPTVSAEPQALVQFQVTEIPATTSIDWNIWDNMPDLDAFQHFDPNFDFDAIDLALADGTQAAFLTNSNDQLF